jgi:lipoyl(octanoyl) transferase
MSLNVNISMKHFGWMNPCGLKQVEISSIQQEVSRKVSMSKVCGAVKNHVESVFGINLIKTSLPELLKKLNKNYDSESNIKKTFKKTRLAETESAIRSHI